MKSITQEINPRTTGIRQFFDELPSHIIPVQKVVPPYMPFKEGHGYMGVLLLDTEKDRVQCHICGLWFKALSAHLQVHGIDAKHYKDKVGLYRKENLLSLRTTLKFRSALKPRSKYNLEKGKRKLMAREYEEVSKQKSGSSTVQWQNRYGTCEAQLKFRLEEEIKKFGRVPTANEAIKLARIFGRRFGNWTNGLHFYGYKNTIYRQKREKKQREIHDELIIAPTCKICGKAIVRLRNENYLQAKDKWLAKKTCCPEHNKLYLKQMFPVQHCKITGCKEKYSAKGYCNAHYLKFIKRDRKHKYD